LVALLATSLHLPQVPTDLRCDKDARERVGQSPVVRRQEEAALDDDQAREKELESRRRGCMVYVRSGALVVLRTI
jgi:hypothetical protein